MSGVFCFRMDQKFLVINFLGMLISSTVAQLPDYIEKCRKDDPQLSKCAKESAQKALPFLIEGNGKYGIPSLNPIQTEKIQFERDGLSMNLMNVKFYGMDQMVFKDMSFDLQNMTFQFTAFFPVVTVLADYDLQGTLLQSLVSGNGRSNVTFTDLETTFQCDMFFATKEDSKQYLQASNMKIDHEDDKLSRAYYEFTNLFSGDKKNGEAILEKMNKNWKKVYDTLGPTFLTPFDQLSKGILGYIGTSIPIEELFQ